MERQNRLLTISIIVLLLLVGAVVYDNNTNGGKKRNADPDAPATHELVDYKPDEVATLTIQNGSAEPLKFEKTAGEWTVVAPKQVAIDASKVSEIVDRFDPVLVEERTLNGDPAGYGLDAAGRAQVTFGTADGRSWSVWVGKETTVGFGTYVQTTDGGPVGIAQKHIADLAHRSLDDFRTKTLWSFSSGTARRVMITRGAERVVLRKDDHGWWLGDEGPRVDAASVTEWLQKADLLRADSFADDGPADLTATAVLTIEDADGTHTLTVGDTDGESVLVKGDGPLARVPAAVNDLVKLTGWAGTTLMEVRKFQVDSIAVQLGEFKTTFVKTEGVWKGADGKPTALAEGLLDTLERTRADRTVTPAGDAAGWGTLTLSETAEGAKHVESLTFGAPDSSGEFARRVARDAAGGPAFLVLQADLDVIMGVARGTLPALQPAAPAGPPGLDGFGGFE